jgi:hypothetical protein
MFRDYVLSAREYDFVGSEGASLSSRLYGNLPKTFTDLIGFNER